MSEEIRCPHCGKLLPNEMVKGLKENIPFVARRPKIEGINCTICGSTRVCRDGKRFTPKGEENQRYLCYECGYRFSLKQE